MSESINESGPNVTLADLYAQCLNKHSDKVAIIDGSFTVTYGSLRERVRRIISLFDAAGITTGDRVGLAVGMSADYIACYMACHIAGVAVADMLPGIPVDDVVYRVGAAKLTVLIMEPGFVGEHGEQIVAAVAGAVKVFATAPIAGARDLHQEAEQLVELAPLRVRPNHGYAAISFSGGSTGLPKPMAYDACAGAKLTMGHMASLPYPAKPVAVVYRATFSVITYNVNPTLLRGGTLITLGRYDLDSLIQAAIEHRANTLFMSVQAIYALIDREDIKIPSGQLKLVFYGGEAIMPSRLSKIVEEIGPILVGSYGCSEATPSVLLLPEDHDLSNPKYLASSGRPILGAAVEIRDKNGNPVETGEYGEITIRSPSRMLHYIDMPEKTKETLVDGWIRTGDVGRMDDEGYVYVLDRLSYSFEVKGKVIYPRAIDLEIMEHPAVYAAATAAVDGDNDNYIVCACVVLRPDYSDRHEEVEQFIKEYDFPVGIDQVLFFEELPKFSESQKINRRELSRVIKERIGS